MENIVLCPESVAAYKELMLTPEKHGITIPPLKECFIDSNEGTPKHILFNEYLTKIDNRPLPKIFFYIVMDDLYRIVKCSDGNLGYAVKIKP